MRLSNVSIKQWAIVIFFFVIIAYSIFQARFMILGPHIEIISPENGATFDNNLILVVGKAENIAFISLNDRPIYIDEQGNWSEKLIAPQGLSIMTVRAKDRFGRNTEKHIEMFVN